MESTTIMHLDLGVLSIIGTIIVQTLGIVWWAATITARMNSVEQDMLSIKSLTLKMDAFQTDLARVGAKTDLLMQLNMRTLQDGKSQG